VNKYFISQLGYIAENYTLVSYGIRQMLLMAVITVIAVAVSLFLPIFRVSRKQPVEVIRTNE
jgi:ABC-type antimicrobial peptide transport system permease subunit